MNIRLKGTIRVLILALLGLFWANSAWATTYYMRADGTDANKAQAIGPCSTASATMSVTTHNSQTFSPGDTIYVCNNGGSFTATLTVPSSGSAGNPKVFAPMAIRANYNCDEQAQCTDQQGKCRNGENHFELLISNSPRLQLSQPPTLAGWTFQEYVSAAYAVVVRTAQEMDT
jgi:hypothetical protein